jgi:hypothetical protein
MQRTLFRTTTFAAALLAALLLAGTALASLKIDAPPRPDDWEPQAEARAYASGPARVVRQFVWGQQLEPASGVFRLSAVDNTWEETPASQDVLNECVARVNVPSEKAEYYVKFIALRPVGERRPTMGGVMVNHDMFGNTGIGGPGMFPRLRAYAAVWGRANVVKNNRVIGRDRPALAWVGQGPRDENGRWRYEPDGENVTAHLVVFGSLGGGTPLEETPDGFLHFEWPTAKVIIPGFTFDPAARPAGTAREEAGKPQDEKSASGAP